MSIEIIQDADEFTSGFINIGGSSFPGLGKLPKRGSIIGIAFNSQRHLDAAIAFLQRARVEVYGKATTNTKDAAGLAKLATKKKKGK